MEPQSSDAQLGIMEHIIINYIIKLCNADLHCAPLWFGDGIVLLKVRGHSEDAMAP